MKFEVIGRDGRVKMYTYDRECIPPAELIAEMKKAGYKCLLDGKVYK